MKFLDFKRWSSQNAYVESSKSSLLFEKLLNRELDIIITSKSGETHPDFISQLLYQEPVVGIYNHRLEKKLSKNQELQDLLAHRADYIEFLPTLTLGIEMRRYFYRLNSHPLSRIKTDSAKNMILLVNSLPVWGIGIPLLMRALQPNINHIRSFSLPEPAVHSTWHLIYRRHEGEKPAEIIIKVFQELIT